MISLLQPNNFNTLDNIMSNICKNTHTISVLVQEKNKTVGKIQARLDLFRYAKLTLSDSQITSFANFMTVTEKESKNLSKAIQSIETEKYLSVVKEELFNSEADYDSIIKTLEEVKSHQTAALNSLKTINTEGQYILNIL